MLHKGERNIFHAFLNIISDSKIIYNLHKNYCSKIKIIVQAEYETEQAMLLQLAGTAETAAA